MFIFKLLKTRKMYKDAQLVQSDVSEGVSEISFDLIKPFVILVNIILILIIIGSILFGYIFAEFKFAKIIFWISFVFFIFTGILVFIIRKVLGVVSKKIVKTGKEISDGLHNRFNS